MRLLGRMLETDEGTFRVINDDGRSIHIANVSDKNIDVREKDRAVAEEKVERGEWSLYKDPLEGSTVDEALLKEGTLEKFHKWQRVFRVFDQELRPDYMRAGDNSPKPAVTAAWKAEGLTKSTFVKQERRYIASGCRDVALVDGRATRGRTAPVQYKAKPGPKSASGVPLTDEVRAHMAWAVAEKMKPGHRRWTWVTAYDAMNRRFYSVPGGGLLPESMRPTFKQFYNYARTHTTKEQRGRAKVGDKAWRNNERDLPNGVGAESYRVCDHVEVDAQDTDVALIDEDGVCWGNPVTYMAVDQKSRLILGVSVEPDRNSDIGLMNLFESIGEDKEEMLRRHGVDAPQGCWPSGYLPETLRFDRGSDMESHATALACERLGWARSLVEGGMGSKKGVMEGIWDALDRQIKPMLEQAGLRTKDADDDHNAEAVLTLEEYRRMVLNFCVFWNSHFLPSLRLTAAEQAAEDAGELDRTPADYFLWRVARGDAPRRVRDERAYLWELLEDSKARVRRGRVTCEGACYRLGDDPGLNRRVEAGETELEVRVDPRSMARIYTVSEGRVVALEINDSLAVERSYKHRPRSVWREAQAAKRKADKRAVPKNDELRARLMGQNAQIVAEAAKRAPVKADDSDVKGARRAMRDKRQAERADESKLARPEADEGTPQEVPVEAKVEPVRNPAAGAPSVSELLGAMRKV